MTTTVIKKSQVQAYFILKPLLDPYVMYLCTTVHVLCCVLTIRLSVCLSAVTNSASWWHQNT